jgi:DNA-binding transcriptional LysR family regulator
MERLDLRLVEYFVAVAEELHFGRAAERLHIAQPSLSQQIRRLEAQLGVTLLERNSRNVELTDAGRILLKQGRKLLTDAQQAMRATREAGVERLRIGFYGSTANALLPETLKAVAARHPHAEVSVRELLFGSIDEITDGEVDLAFTRFRPGQAELEIVVLTEEPRFLALPVEHRLAGRPAVSFGELADESFIVNPAVAAAEPPPRWL